MLSNLWGRRRLAATGLTLAVLATLVPLLMAGPASADTPTTHTPRATTSSQSNVAPPGPLTALTDGQTVTVTVTEAGAADQISSLELRLCRGDANITNSGTFLPSNGQCTNAAVSAGSDFRVGPSAKANASDNFITLNFRVGVGSNTWLKSNGQPATITCDAANSCDLWASIGRSGGNDFVHWDLQYVLGQPGAPTGVQALCGTNQLTVSWTAPSNTGGGTIVKYTVVVDPSAGSPTGTVDPADVEVAGAPPGTSTVVGGLTNFSNYDVTVKATNEGSPGNQQTSAASSPVVTAAPCVTQAPVQGAASDIGDGEATVNWTYTNTANPGHVGFEIRLVDSSDGTSQVITVTGPSATSRQVTGLANGHLYVSTVYAQYGSGQYSAASNEVQFAPVPGTAITQTITVRRPEGALVLTQICTEGNAGQTARGPEPAFNQSGGSPAVSGGYLTGGADDPQFPNYPYPQDPVTGDPIPNYPTDCGIDLGAARLITTGSDAGKFFRATGALNQVTVVDTRDTDPGFNVNGVMGNFVNANGDVIVGDELGWAPAAVDTGSVTFSDGSTYDQTVTPGPVVGPNQPSGPGLGSGLPNVLASALAGAGLGIAQVDAGLDLYIPITAKTGDYVGVLTITAV